MSNNKKSNFGKAAYEMFGVGKAEKETAAPAAEVKEPVVTAERSTDPVSPFVTPVEKKTTYLAAGSCIEGTMKVDGDLEILSTFKGTLEVSGVAVIHSNMEATVKAASMKLVGCKLVGDCHVSGKVMVDEKSSVEGNMFVENLDCSGEIKGDIQVSDQAVFRATAKLDGNVETKGITVERGAVLMGSIKM